MNNKLNTVLTIAGSDSSGGAGIQADLKTMTALGVYGMSAITALTAQNTMGVTDIMEVTTEFLKAQLDSVFTDIYPDAVKIGMVSSVELIKTISQSLKEYDAKNIVVDPVMVATSGSKLLQDNAIEILKEELFPLAEVLTPNIPEGEILAEMEIKNEEDMMTAAKIIGDKYNCAVLLKGGHRINDANDLLYKDGEYQNRPEPTEEEKREAELTALDSEYARKISDIETGMAKAKAVEDEDYYNDLKAEREELVAEYTEKRGAI